MAMNAYALASISAAAFTLWPSNVVALPDDSVYTIDFITTIN